MRLFKKHHERKSVERNRQRKHRNKKVKKDEKRRKEDLSLFSASSSSSSPYPLALALFSVQFNSKLKNLKSVILIKRNTSGASAAPPLAPSQNIPTPHPSL
jgi:hypothetical protein